MALQPAMNNAPNKKMPPELRLALKKVRGAFIATAAFSFFINLLLFVSPLYMLQVYDRVLTSRSVPTLVMLTIAAFGALGVMALLEWMRSRVLVRVGVRLDEELNGRIFSSIFKRTVNQPGAASAQPLRDLDTVREFLTGAGLLALFDGPWAPLFLAVAFLLHPLIGLLSLFGMVLVLVLALANNWFTQKSLKRASDVSTSATGYVSSSLRNGEALTAMGMLPQIRERWALRHRAVLGLQGRASDTAGMMLSISKTLRMALQSAVLGLGAYLVIENQISAGMIIAGSIIMGRALQPVEMAVGNWRNMINAKAAYGRLTDLLNSTPADRDTMPLPRPAGRVSLSQVVAVPPGSRLPALRGVSLNLEPGEVLGVIGPSAAGKSTLARVMIGVWPTFQGSVRLDGSDISHWDRSLLGPYLGYLPQDVELFDGTVAENICRFTEVDPDKVIEAATKAGVHELIQQLPEGYNTPIGAGGQTLSGGQRQRVALARAMYDSPSLVVMDEPNASLDAEGEAALTAAIRAMRENGQTVVVITHKPSLLSVVDKVLVLRGGLVEMLGPRDEVLAKFTRPTAVPTAPASAGSAAPAASVASLSKA
ncbi:type I secretion system permease/ATPase [Caenispirillum bisanense]|uniref:ATP-binding cassette, subfamily C/ATP-binding cassette, subfamily C, EexD n=1 Tax=Caenispirillum bisanense TaxID=414052 RepID=A0A286GUI2_9PROT|nr:type I secretion system permease/ATPase [Caenispirillum bisanense]SOD98769.1 ATP-binding cassette, subfamily C/ATP-binding cassette, subfamily C, EexD [Caenispirillum bisanense]